MLGGAVFGIVGAVVVNVGGLLHFIRIGASFTHFIP